MKYSIILPPAHLRDYVRFFWALEGEAGQADPYLHRTMADGCTEMLFHYQGGFDELSPDGTSNRSFHSGIQAQTQCFRRYVIKENFGIFGVYLFPFAIPALFSISATELSDRSIDIYDLFGPDGLMLEEKVMLAADNSARVKIVSEFLGNKIQKTVVDRHNVLSSVRYIIEAKGALQVKDLSEMFSFSKRQFERKFKEYAGFSPKLYSRIIRFQQAASCYRNQFKTLTEVAVHCGYYDQSHFIHDFRQFSGYNPKTFFAGNNEGTAWMEA